MIRDRALSAEMSTLMAALRLTLSPADPQVLTALRDAAQVMVAVEGETVTRQRFRIAAQVCAMDPTPAHVEAMGRAMNEYNRTDLLPFAPPPEDPRWQRRMGRPGRNGVEAAMPPDPTDLYTDM